MFEEAEGLEHPYFMTKHESEKIVRKESKVPWTVYRPALVVGDSQTGEMDKIDGPYYFFKLIQRMRQLLPPWMPSVGLEGGRINIVPVDFVVAAIDHISHLKTDLDKRCFHLVDPVGYRVGDVLDIFSRAAHAPKMNLFVNAALLGFIPKGVKKGLMALAPVRRIKSAVMKDLGLPDDMFTFINFPTRYDCREALAALKGSGIECPKLDDYAWRLWDYWERHLDPALHVDHSLRGTVAGKVVLVTGGSSGIGLAAACKFAEAGAITVICARDEAKLVEAKREILAAAGKGAIVETYSADIADEASCKGMVDWLNSTHGGVDFLINNAGRSIRRAIEASYDRFHDFERTMQLNYFGCLRVTMGFLPGMVAKKKGHIVNISSIGVLTNAPRFSAYVASQGGARRLDPLRLERVRRHGDLVHHHQHAAGAHADDRPDQDLRQRAGALARGRRQHDRRGLRRKAGAHRHPARHHRRAAARPGAAGGADRHELDLPDVPRQRRRQGRQGQEVRAFSRGDRDAADDARDSLLSAATRR